MLFLLDIDCALVLVEMDGYIAFSAEMLRAKGIGSAHLVGHSVDISLVGAVLDLFDV